MIAANASPSIPNICLLKIVMSCNWKTMDLSEMVNNDQFYRIIISTLDRHSHLPFKFRLAVAAVFVWWLKWLGNWLMLFVLAECKCPLCFKWCKLVAILPPTLFPICKTVCGWPFKLFVIVLVCCCIVEPMAAASAVSSPVELVVQSDMPQKLWIHFFVWCDQLNTYPC